MPLNSLRLRLARFLVVVSFVWPFVNASYFFPDSLVEINFVLVFVAMGLVPEVFLEDGISLLLIAGAAAVATIWGTADAALRIIVGTVPFIFIVGLYRHFLRRGGELIPRRVAYSALVVFVGFCLLQEVHFSGRPIIPDWLTSGLAAIVPRYMDAPYDDLGTRGVQGWASEPSSAAMTCFSFCAVAMQQDPKKRWHILLIFGFLTALNKSVYAMLFLILLGLACIFHSERKRDALAALVPFGALVAYFLAQSARIAEVRDSLTIFGADQEVNRELLRLGQIVYPLSAFPRMYNPVVIFGINMQPLGLLPLLIGFGSVIGAVLYWRLMFGGLPLSEARWKPLGLAALLSLSFLASPDFIPMIVAFAYGMAPKRLAAPLAAHSRKVNVPLATSEAC